MKNLLMLLFLLQLLSLKIYSQNHFTNTPDAYLGQKPPNDKPKVFAKKMLVPDSGIALDRSAFSPDGKVYYYCTTLHWFDSRGAKIRYYKYEGKKWQGPFILNEGYYAPTFSIDGKSMFFLGGPPDTAYSIVSVSHRAPTGWTKPQIYLKKPYGLYDFMPTKSGTFYIASNVNKGARRNFQTYDFCTLSLTAKDTIVKSLGPLINTPGFNGDFFVSPDESYMIVSYKEKPDYECELGISFRTKAHTWSAPINLGPLINNGNAHRWGQYISPDGKYLFYTQGTSEKDCNIYWVRFDKKKEKLRREFEKLNSRT